MPVEPPTEDSLLPSHPACRQEGVAIRDRYHPVDDPRVVGAGPEVLTDPLHQIGPAATARVDGALRIGGDHLHRGLLRLQIPPDAADRATGAHACDEVGDASRRLSPDLGTGGGLVGARIAGIGVLVGLECSRRRRGDPVGHRVVRVGVLWSDRSRTYHDLRPEGPEELTLLLGDLVGHGEDALVAALCRHHGQTDARVARRRFDDGATETEQPVGLGGIEHREGRPVLDAATGIEILEFGQKVTRQISPDPVEPDERRVADEIECAFRHLHRRAWIGDRVHLDALWW